MTLFSATILPGLLLIVLGAALLIGNSLIVSTLKAFPRSRPAAIVFFGGAALWFLCVVWNISQADLVLFDSSKPFVLFFALIALAAFYYIPDFLAVRGVCVLVLLAAWEILTGTFGEYDAIQHKFVNTAVYAAVALAIYFGCVPYRARDFLQWLFVRPQRARILGGGFFAYGLLLSALAFVS